MRTRIALDFDGTFTADPDLWTQFIANAEERGHTVMCVTARDGTEQDLSDLKSVLPGGMEIIFTRGLAKRRFCLNEGFGFDIWIEDHPEWVVHDIDVE